MTNLEKAKEVLPDIKNERSIIYNYCPNAAENCTCGISCYEHWNEECDEAAFSLTRIR